MKKIDKNEQYTKDFLKWQNNQYNLGVYVGGNFPIDAKHGGNKNRKIILVQAIVILFSGLAIILWSDSKFSIAGYIIFSLGLIVALGISWRIYYYKK